MIFLADQFSAGYVTVFAAQGMRLAGGRALSTLAEVVSDVWLEHIRHISGTFPMIMGPYGSVLGIIRLQGFGTISYMVLRRQLYPCILSEGPRDRDGGGIAVHEKILFI